MDAIQRTLIRAGRKDLAVKYYHKITASDTKRYVSSANLIWEQNMVIVKGPLESLNHQANRLYKDVKKEVIILNSNGKFKGRGIIVLDDPYIDIKKQKLYYMSDAIEDMSSIKDILKKLGFKK